MWRAWARRCRVGAALNHSCRSGSVVEAGPFLMRILPLLSQCGLHALLAFSTRVSVALLEKCPGFGRRVEAAALITITPEVCPGEMGRTAHQAGNYT